MASQPAPNPVVGDLVVIGPGASNIGSGLYIVIGAVAAAGPYTVASAESPNSAHAGTVAKSRILAVYRGA